jgi:transposase
MLLQESNLSVWLYAHLVDMRKQFDGLAALAQSTLKREASSGELFVFINKRRTYIKILYYSRGGYCLWSKRLEQGQFHRVSCDDDKTSLNWAQLQCLIEGINWQKKPLSKRYIR